MRSLSPSFDMSDQATKSLAFAIADWLHSKDVESVDASKRAEAAKLISEAFGVDTSNASERATYAKGSPGLRAIFDVFLKAQAKMAPAETKQEATPRASDEDQAKAEQLKNDGNKYMTAKDYGAALNAYTKAIELNGASPVYYSNRAAAYSQIGQHDEAVADAKKAAEIDPQFGKAYSRLGHALFASGKYEEAHEAYQKGCEVDPSNKLMKSGLDASKAKLAAGKRDGAVASPANNAANEMPNFGGGGGGMPDLSSLLNNPMLSSMAQQMMQNGGLEQLMNNPMLRQMAEQFGGSGQMPDINAMMNNPQLRQYVPLHSRTEWRSSSWAAWAAAEAPGHSVEGRVSLVTSRGDPRPAGPERAAPAWRTLHPTALSKDGEPDVPASCVCTARRIEANTRLQC